MFLPLRQLMSVFLLVCLPLAAQAADPANLVRWRDGFTSSAQPDTDYLKRAKSLGYEMVINLAPPEYAEAVETEGAILARQGVAYLNIPINWGNPTAQDFRLFAEMMKATEKKNVLVHCQINLRGSSFSFLYRVLHEGAPLAETRDKLLGVWMPNATWKKFIDATMSANGKKMEWL